MKIEIYALCHQEAPMIPYFMRHYNQYGKIFLFESGSTDGSADLARSLGATMVSFDTGNQIRDDLYLEMKNNCWKKSKADWVIIVDMDEFVYHANFKEYLKTIKGTIIQPRHYEMFSDVFPTTQGQIYEEVTMGATSDKERNTSAKLCLFKPQEITEMNYEPGAHFANPTGNVIVNDQNEVISMHMRHLNIDYIMKRNAYFISRLSAINNEKGWGSHYKVSRDNVQNWYDIHKPNLVKVV